MKSLNKLFKKIGPGFVTGAADDDPSGIATYSVAGAQFGYKMTWMALFLLPAMITIQEMCGRIGLTSGMGLAGAIRKYHSKRLLVWATTLLAIANITNIGANLGIMAASMQMILGFPFWYWLIVIAFFVIWMEIAIPYKLYSKFLKVISLVLLVYVGTAFAVKQDWSEIVRYTFLPRIEFKNMEYIMTMVGFLGTTISPYLFFWQPSEEVEEEIEEKRIKDFGYRANITRKDINKLDFNTKMGMFFSNLIAFFIIITASATLNRIGVYSIDTPQQAALALQPVAGNLAYILFTVGIIGIGLQSIPILAGSLAYALSESFQIKEGLSKTFKQAKGFYLIIAISTIIGALMNLIGIDTMKALYYTAIINGIAAVPLIAIIIKLSDDERIVGKFKNNWRKRIIGWTIFTFMLIAVLIMTYNTISTEISWFK